MPKPPKKHPMPYDDEDDRELFDDPFSVASSMECTGLIPAAPEEEAEIDSYSEIYDIPLADKTKPAQHNLQDKQKKRP